MNDAQLICCPENFLIRVPQHLGWFLEDLIKSGDLTTKDDIEAMLLYLIKFTSPEKHAAIEGVIDKLRVVKVAS
jgi:hypothetical protein